MNSTLSSVTPIEEEALRIGEMKHVAIALIQFSRSLFRGEFTKRSTAWVYSPNFVAFEIRYQRAHHFNVLVRPVATPDCAKGVLSSYQGPFGYGRLEVRRARQFAAAAAFIEASWRDWHIATFHEQPSHTAKP